MQRTNKAFTLIELLVVIAIIAILAAILFPVFAQAKLAAKKTTDLSNVKEITLGLIMYGGDADDHGPLIREQSAGSAGVGQNDALGSVWKDETLPYIKNGGRSNTGNTETSYNQGSGNGGIFQSQLHANPWSSESGVVPAPGAGDETTRFARSYSVNRSAGLNENGGGSGHSTNADSWWSNYYVGTGYSGLEGQNGSFTSLTQPAQTVAITPSRWGAVDFFGYEARFGCDAGGGWGPTPGLSCALTDGSGFSNFGFFDGHAKGMKLVAAHAADIFDECIWVNNTWGDTCKQYGIDQANLN